MSLKKAAESVRAAGRGKDTELVHLTRNEVAGLHALAGAAGGKLTRNPKTGMPEAGFLDSLLPTLLGAAANFVVPGSGLVVGGLTGALQNKENPLMGAALGAMGGYGGGNLAAGLQGVGAGAAQQAAITGTQDAAAQQLAAAGADLTAQGVSNLGAASNQVAADATKQFMTQPFYEQAGAGLSAAVNNPAQYIEGLGGGKAAFKAATMAAAPSLAGMAPSGGMPFGDAPEARKYRYEAGYTGGAPRDGGSYERQWFDPTFTRMAAGGGVGLASGGFVIPADVVSMLGNGSSDAGLEALAKHLGATPIDGGGDGMSDSILAEIDGQAPAAVARQEAYLSPDKVRAAGGEAKLYELLERVRQAAHGTRQQQNPVEPAEMLG
jgi:hypothetical protein